MTIQLSRNHPCTAVYNRANNVVFMLTGRCIDNSAIVRTAGVVYGLV